MIGIAALQQLIRRKTNRNNTDSTRLTVEDKSYARTTMMVEGESFSEAIKQLKDCVNNEVVKVHSQLYKLDPFLHNDGTIRVGGRLKHASSLHYYNAVYTRIITRDIRLHGD